MNTTQSTCGGFTCPLTGFQFFLNKKFITASVVSIVWFNLFSWFWHGSVMMEAYQATGSLWRAPQEMSPLILNGGISLMGFFATYIFMKGYTGTGIREGIRFGIIMTLLFGGLALVTYATQPIPLDIIKMWVIGDLVQFIGCGIILSQLFGKKECCN